jgi:hypothetical protein
MYCGRGAPAFAALKARRPAAAGPDAAALEALRADIQVLRDQLAVVRDYADAAAADQKKAEDQLIVQMAVAQDLQKRGDVSAQEQKLVVDQLRRRIADAELALANHMDAERETAQLAERLRADQEAEAALLARPRDAAEVTAPDALLADEVRAPAPEDFLEEYTALSGAPS